MEFLEGRELGGLIAQRPQLSLRDKLSVITQVCDGLSHLHRHGIIHQDIRPSSIFVLLDGQVKILDSGIARQALPQDSETTRTRFLLDDYRAPEQARGRSEQRSDIFSVGTVLFELLTYRRPPGTLEPNAVREQLATVDPPLPTELIAVVNRALRQEPAERFRDAEQMRDELERVLRGLPATPERVRVLFTLHGIRTHATWQKALMEIAHMRQWNCRTFRWSFGYFSLLQFLLPWQRATKVEWFRDTYDTEIKSREVNLPQGQLPSIVAHGFGTHILGNALLANKHIRFDKVVLCGSILPCDFAWDTLIARGQVQAVRNEFGTKDVWPRLVRWFVRGTGPSGRVGFNCQHERLEQEEFLFSHSAYFDKGHIEANWFPFLERTLPEAQQTQVAVSRSKANTPLALYLLYTLILFVLGCGLVKLIQLLMDLFGTVGLPAS
jgi:hypothetical protein